MNPFDVAQRFAGITEIDGIMDNPIVLTMLKLDNEWPEHDEVPWCSAFTNFIAWMCRLPRSKSLRARSWLEIGQAVELGSARPGDVVILNRAGGPQDPTIIDAPGHVGFYAGKEYGFIEVLGGNQSNQVKVSRYPVDRILGIRRLT